MPANTARLSLMAFPQSWSAAGEIGLRILTLPKGDPLAPLDLLAEPAFAQTDLVLDAVFVPGLAALPKPADPPERVQLTLDPRPLRADLFDALRDMFKIAPAPPVQAAAAMRILKYLPPGYRAASGMTRPRTPMALTDSTYQCALRDGPATPPPAAPPPDNVTWGQVLGYALRQPRLAAALGLLHRVPVSIDADIVVNGGWLYVDLRPGSTYSGAAAGVIARYAARIPPLSGDRALFASALFPVVAVAPGNYDTVFIEAEAYSDGFAKIVHGAQPKSSGLIDTNPGAIPPVRDLGIRLAWDDEQLTTWMNRQVGVDPQTGGATNLEAPMGVMGYRVDVRLAGSTDWTSLNQARGPVMLGDFDLGTFDAELNVEVLPISVRAQDTGDYWLPAYFTAWAGGSIVLSDPDAYRLTGQDAIAKAGPYTAQGADVRLEYGNDYEFRVRLADLSGGGPEPGARQENPAQAPIGRVEFRRYVPPKSVEATPITIDPDGRTARCTVSRPRLAYPDAIFTGQPGTLAALEADAAALKALHDEEGDNAKLREVSIPDPDVQWVEVSVAAQGPALDPAHPDGLTPIYTARREFQGDSLELEFTFVDTPQLADLPDPGTGGPLPVPSARRLRVAMRAVAREDDDLSYFGSDDARRGPVADPLYFGSAAGVEDAFLVPSTDQQRLQAVFLQPGAEDRLARQLDLDQSGLTLSGRNGRRVVFGCVPQIRHTLAPDRGSITFSTAAELSSRWIVAIRLTLNRDWTWDGLDVAGIEVVRDGVDTIGTILLPRVVNSRAPDTPDRTQIDIVFFDAVDPEPIPPNHPDEIAVAYAVRPSFPAANPADSEWITDVRLPVAARPRQTPKLVSAGIAFSPYVPGPNYASSEVRDRRLWLEFDRPPDDPRDAYFVRVLSSAPDPVLLDHGLEERPEPPDEQIALDPEPIRVITRGQPRDDAGFQAMDPLSGDPSRRRYLVPRPRALGADAPELFGFFVYEIRLGHDRQRWCTAQGRFGPPLRVTGLQHPAPPLLCTVHRTAEQVWVGAPHATPIRDGHSELPKQPKTDLWVLLYAQVMQVDGATHRNVLLLRRRGDLMRDEDDNFDLMHAPRPAMFSLAVFSQREISLALASLALPANLPLSVVAVEMMPQEVDSPARVDPLGERLGAMRILRTSNLTPVPPVCVPVQVA
jgi:hypothetical protein